MPIHDWTRVSDGAFHDFHNGWIIHLKEALNGGVLPSGFYAQSEQHLGRKIGDVLTLHASNPDFLRNVPEPTEGSVAVAEVPPKVGRTLVSTPTLKHLRRTLTIRHTSGHRIVALIEILSPANKVSAENITEFVRKVTDALESGVHVVVLDLFPPGSHDPDGMHNAIMAALGNEPEPLPNELPLTFASYRARDPVVIYLDQRAVGDALPETPLFLTVERYIPLPLEETYSAAYRGIPGFWREVLEGKRSAPENS